MRFLFFTILLFCTQVGLAQNQQTNNISGVVLDREDSAPVQFAYLYLKNYPDFSALADERGEFKFFFPSQFLDETLVISSIGYEKKEVSISSLAKTGNSLKLQRQLLSLNEVTVMPEDNSMEEMISKAIDNIPKNYPDKRHHLRGFYRKISTNYEEFTKLVEAAVLVEDVGYKKDGLSLRIKLESLRQGDELGELDSSMVTLKQRIRAHIKSTGSYLGPLNEIIGTYQNNGFRGDAYHSKTWFGKDGDRFMGIPELPTYHRFMGEEVVGNDTIYQIAFSSKDPPNGNSYLKINSRNYAIVEYQFRLASGEYEYFAKFREVDGVYYPEMLRNKELRLINRDVGTHQMDISTIWFDVPVTKDLKRIRAKDALSRDDDIEPNKYELDSSFWKTYDLIKKYPLDSAIIRNLEQDSSLEQQFKRSAKD